MSISCGCEYDGGIRGVGDPKFMTCRTPRKCQECNCDIKAGDGMYRYNMYDWAEYKASPSHWMCESCGDLMVSIMQVGFCFYLGGIKDQWRDYCLEQQSRGSEDE